MKASNGVGSLVGAVAVLGALGCSSSSAKVDDAGAPHDAKSDARKDAAKEAGSDASNDAVVDSGPEGLTCGKLLSCDQNCGSSTSCTNGCYAQSTGVAQGLFDAFNDCLDATCAHSDASDCDTTAATGACSSHLLSCLQDKAMGKADPDGGSVIVVPEDAGRALNCGGLIACGSACKLTDAACIMACNAKATPEARAFEGVLNACLAAACPGPDGGACALATTECQGCIEQSELTSQSACAVSFDSCENDSSNALDAGTKPVVLEDGGVVETTLNDINGAASTIVFEGGYLYYAEVVTGRPIRRLDLTSGKVTTLGPAQPTPVGLAIDANNVYVFSVGTFVANSSFNNGDGAVVQVPLDGGAAVTLSSTTEVEYDAPYLNSVAVDSTSVYWVAGAKGDDGTIMRATIGQHDAKAIYKGQSIPEAIATDGTNVYWGNWGTFDSEGHSNNDGTISQGPVAGGTAKVLASHLSAPATIAIDAKNVYWCDLGPLGAENLPAPNTGAVLQVPIGGGAVTTLASQQAVPLGIAVNHGTVYWAAYGFSAPGLILSVKAGGGTVVPLVANLSDPFEVAISGKTIYWTNTPSSDGHGSILSLTPF